MRGWHGTPGIYPGILLPCPKRLGKRLLLQVESTTVDGVAGATRAEGAMMGEEAVGTRGGAVAAAAATVAVEEGEATAAEAEAGAVTVVAEAEGVVIDRHMSVSNFQNRFESVCT